MKFQKRLLTPSTQHPLDTWIMLTVIAALALWVGSIPLIFTSEISNSPANNPAIQGEAGLWSVLGEKE